MHRSIQPLTVDGHKLDDRYLGLGDDGNAIRDACTSENARQMLQDLVLAVFSHHLGLDDKVNITVPCLFEFNKRVFSTRNYAYPSGK